MVTNITKLKDLYGMRLHTAKKIDELFTHHLPHGYSSEISRRALKNGTVVSSTEVRQVKNLFRKNIEIINYLLILATETKANAVAQKEQLKKLTS